MHIYLQELSGFFENYFPKNDFKTRVFARHPIRSAFYVKQPFARAMGPAWLPARLFHVTLRLITELSRRLAIRMKNFSPGGTARATKTPQNTKKAAGVRLASRRKPILVVLNTKNTKVTKPLLRAPCVLCGLCVGKQSGWRIGEAEGAKRGAWPPRAADRRWEI